MITERFDRINNKTNRLLDKQKGYKLNNTANLHEYNAVKNDDLPSK